MVTHLKFILLTALLFTSFANAAPVITLSADQFSPGESVIIKIKNLPGNHQDWLTLVKVDAPASKFGEWSYTKGVTEGTWTFSAPKRPGDYEVRVFFDYPAGGETIHARAAVKVIAKKKSQPQTTVQAGKPESKTTPTMTSEQSQNLEAYNKSMEQQYQKMFGNKKQSAQTTKQKQIEQPQQNPSLASSNPVTSTAAHKTNPITEFLLTSFDEIWIAAKGQSLGKTKDVMSRLSKMGYEKQGAFVGAVRNNAYVSIHAVCENKPSCDSDDVITNINLKMKLKKKGKEFLFPNLVDKTLAHLRTRIGKETKCRKRSEQSIQCDWMPSSGRPYHGLVSLDLQSRYPSPGAGFQISLQKM